MVSVRYWLGSLLLGGVGCDIGRAVTWRASVWLGEQRLGSLRCG